MHTKQFGNIGEAAVSKKLMELGYAVFTELGDLSKVDLVALKDNDLIKIQVKYITLKEGKVELPVRKCGPNYIKRYTTAEIDLFAIYVPDNNQVLFVSSNILESTRSSYTIRFIKPKTGSQHKSHWWEDYIALP